DTMREDLLEQRLRWCDPHGETLLTERRRLNASVPANRWDVWMLDLTYELTAPGGRDVRLGSPVTNGRPDGAGYGGFFWRAPLADVPPHVFTATAEGANAVNGTAEPWVAMVTDR